MSLETSSQSQLYNEKAARPPCTLCTQMLFNFKINILAYKCSCLVRQTTYLYMKTRSKEVHRHAEVKHVDVMS